MAPRHLAWINLGLIFSFAGGLAYRSSAADEPRRPANPAGIGVPFDFSQMMKGILGEETEADRKVLERIAVPWDEEKKYGGQAASAFLDELAQQGISATDRGADAEYLRQLVNLIRPQMKNAARYKQIKVHVADSKRTDARSFPGGTLIFFRGILDFAESEAALVGVVGHELSHLDHGHQLNTIRRIKLAQRQFAGGNAGNFEQFMKGGLGLARGFAKPFRPEEEAEADRDGVTWMLKAGYDPRELAALFLRLHNRAQQNPDRGPNLAALPGFDFFRTHPAPVDRHDSVLKLFQQSRRDPQIPLYVGRSNLAQRVPRDVQRFDE